MARRVAVLMKKTISGRWTVWATLREVMQKEVHFAVGGRRWNSSFRSRFTRRVAWRSTVSKDTSVLAIGIDVLQHVILH